MPSVKLNRFTVPLRLITIDENGCHILVRVSINGSPGHNLIIDTGASMTVFDIKLLNSIIPDAPNATQVESHGFGHSSLDARTNSIEVIRINRIPFYNFPAVLIDMDSIKILYKKNYGVKISGLLGGDFLRDFDAVIDYKNQILILNKPL